MTTKVEEDIIDLVDEICDLIENSTDMDKWSRESRQRYQNMLLERIKNELEAREA
jgi:hypothetical protein